MNLFLQCACVCVPESALLAPRTDEIAYKIRSVATTQCVDYTRYDPDTSHVTDLGMNTCFDDHKGGRPVPSTVPDR